MESPRYLLILFMWIVALLIFPIIHALMPKDDKGKKERDDYGMELYQPVFFGYQKAEGNDDKRRAQKESVKEISRPESEEKKEPTRGNAEVADAELPKEMPPEKEAETSDDKEDPFEKEPLHIPYEPNDASLTDTAYFEKLVENYKNKVLSQTEYRNDVVVRYYKHLRDSGRAEVLVPYGFYLHVRPVDSSGYVTNICNMINYGQDFPVQDIKLIAYLLLENGMPIKRVVPFKYFDGWKHKSIEIWADPSLENAPPLSLEELRSLESGNAIK